MTRPLAIGISITAAIVAAAWLWFYVAFVRGERSTERPGGHWTIEFTRYPADSYGLGGRLFYEERGHRSLIAESVHFYRYYGDDCLAYESIENGSEQFYFVCGRHAPLPLNEQRMSAWEFEPDALQQHPLPSEASGVGSGSGERLPINVAKMRAIQQTPLNQGNVMNRSNSSSK